MDHPFKDINEKGSTPLQKSQGRVVARKGSGRPARPNMESFSIRMDKNLHAQLSQDAASMDLSKSAFISRAVQIYRSLLKSTRSMSLDESALISQVVQTYTSSLRTEK